MKKIILSVVALAAISLSASAQVSVGAGYLNDATKSVYKVSNTSTENSWCSNGFYVQGMYTLPIAKGFGLDAGVKFSYLHGEQSGDVNIGSLHLANATSKTNETYLAVPVFANYKYKINRDFSVFAFAGPTFSLGLTSKTDVTATVLGQSKTTNYDNYAKDDDGDASDYKRGNIFLGGGLGVDLKNTFRISLGYDFGLLNRTSVDNTTRTQNQFYVGVAFLF